MARSYSIRNSCCSVGYWDSCNKFFLEDIFCGYPTSVGLGICSSVVFIQMIMDFREKFAIIRERRRS
jgi:hypothetical protein